MRDGLPVLERHPDQHRVAETLSRGFSGRLLRLFELEQHYLQVTRGIVPEPAYLLLSGRVGGFPRFGFILEGDAKRSVGFVDIQNGNRLSGVFGATDQIFPHELAHIIVTQLAGRRAGSGANQIHAVSVRTDPETAFSEGFAEHMQVMALDDPDADPGTQRLVAEPMYRERTERQLRAFARELEARWAPAGAMRGSFVLWFSGTESVLRYWAVKSNAYAYEPAMNARLLAPDDPYAAYLVESIVPGGAAGRRKSRARALSTEGVVSMLFWRWVTAPALQQRTQDASWYRAFGVDPAALAPLEHAYLKLFFVFDRAKPGTTEETIAAYRATFPDEAHALDDVVRGIVGGETPAAEPPIWLANRDFVVGTTLFDQWRRIPRVHTFDLNAASLVDVLGIPGMTRDAADGLLAGAPYRSLDQVRSVAGMTPQVMARLSAMAGEMTRLRSAGSESDEELNLRAILIPYVWRAAAWIIVAGACGALLRRRFDRIAWGHATLSGLCAGGSTLLAAYVLAPVPAWAAMLVPVVLFGLPCGLIRAIRLKRTRRAPAGSALLGGSRVLAGWVVASLPAVVLMGPLF